MHVPDGYTYALARAEYHGTASLAAGATGTQRANYYFSGQQSTRWYTHTFIGPFDDDWQTVDEIDVADMVFNTDLRVSAAVPDPPSFLAMSSSVSTLYLFEWKHCS